jgi:hypothetical protein
MIPAWPVYSSIFCVDNDEMELPAPPALDPV